MSVKYRPRRSVLYMPAANERALEKAKDLQADALIFDLEDAVSPENKELARDQACAAASSSEYGNRELTIRCNGLDTPWGSDDVVAAAAAAPAARDQYQRWVQDRAAKPAKRRPRREINIRDEVESPEAGAEAWATGMVKAGFFTSLSAGRAPRREVGLPSALTV